MFTFQKRWRADGAINRNEVKILTNQKWSFKRWQNVRVGNIVKMNNNTFFPADIVLLSSRYSFHIVLVVYTLYSLYSIHLFVLKMKTRN